MNSSFDVVIRIKEEQLNILKEKLQEAKLEVSYWENQEKEWVKKKEHLEKNICSEKENGHLKHAKIYDECLLFIDFELLQVKRTQEKMALVIQKYNQEIYALLQDRKKFEKLQHKRHDKE